MTQAKFSLKSFSKSTEGVAHAWATSNIQGQEAHFSAGNLSFNNKLLVSYSTPVAYFVPECMGFGKPIALFSSNRYSNTTARHMQKAVNALPHHVDRVDVHSLPGSAVVWADPQDKFFSDNLKCFVSSLKISYNACCKKFSVVQARNTLHKLKQLEAFYLAFKATLEKTYVNLRDLVECHEIDWNTLDDITNRLAAHDQKVEDTAEARKQRRIEAEDAVKAQRKLLQSKTPEELLALWRANTPHVRCPSNPLGTDYLRLSASKRRVETSRGVHIPVEDAKAVWPELNRLKVIADRRREVIVLRDKNLVVGQFQVLSITSEQVVIGCHTIPWAEIDTIATQLGLKAPTNEVEHVTTNETA